MQRETFAKLALGSLAICACGSVVGTGLANYTTSGNFEIYRQASASDWQAELPAPAVAFESADRAFASDHRSFGAEGAAEEMLASLER
jgi:hypothetical protein